MAALAAAVVLAGCGSGGKPVRAHGATLTVYLSAPRRGPSSRMAGAVTAGARLALADAGGRAGDKRVRLIALDSSKPQGLTWDPSIVQANATRAADDQTAIAYIGELSEGASAVSLPVTNAKGILQVSPADGLTGLTRAEPGGAPAARPERFYPSGERTFLRLVPNDYSEAAAIAGWARARGARRIAVVQDERLAGRELASEVRFAAGRLHMTIAAGLEASDDPATYPALAKRIHDARPDAILYTGIGDAPAGALLAALTRAAPGAALFGASSLATAEPAPSGLPAVSVVKPGLVPPAYGARGRRVLARLARRRGTPAPVEALYGYEAMRVILDALRAAGHDADDRAAVVRAALAPRLRRSVVGDYRVVSGGEVSTVRFGAFRRRGERLVPAGARIPPAALR